MPAAPVPMLELAQVPEPETPEMTPSPPTPPPAAVAMQEIQKMREELRARAERAKLQMQAQAHRQAATPGGGTGLASRGGLPALAALRPIRPTAMAAVAVDRLSGLMADNAPSRAARLQGLALSPFARNTPAMSASRLGQPRPAGLSPLSPLPSLAASGDGSPVPDSQRSVGSERRRGFARPDSASLQAVPGSSARRFGNSGNSEEPPPPPPL